MRKVLILVFVFMTLMGYAQDYPKLKPLKEENLEGQLIPFERKGKYGYKNLEGRVVIRAVFDKAETFETLMYDRLVARVKCGEEWGIIDRSGIWYITPEYKYLSAFEKDVAIFENAEGFGLLSHKGTHICEGLQRIDPFDARGYAWVMKDDMWGVINRLGLYMIKPILSDNESRHLHGTLYTVKGRGNLGVIDFKDFKFLIGLKYDEITMLNNNMIKCKKGAKVSVITKKGYPVVDGSTALEKIGTSQWKFLGENGWGTIDENGQLILRSIYNSIKYVVLNDKPAYVLEMNGKYGLSDLYGRRIIPIVLETDQFESYSSKKYFEYWREGEPYGASIDGKNYKCNVAMSSLSWPASSSKIQKIKTLGTYLSENGAPFYAEINRDKEFIYKDGFDEYSWARKVAELIAPNSEGKIVPVGLWLDKILKTLNVEKMAEYYCREFQYGLSQAYAALEQTHIEIHLVQNEALGDGKSLVVADLSVSGHHIQRFVSILNEEGTAIASVRFDGRVYDWISGIEVDGMEITRIDNNIVFTYCRFCDNSGRSEVYTEDLKFQFRSADRSIKRLVSVNDAYYFTESPAYSSSDILYKVNKGDSKLIMLDEDFSGELTCFQDFVFIHDETLSKYGDKVQKFFTCGKENEIINALAFSTFVWDGRKVIMMYTMDGGVRQINYESNTSMAGANIYLPKPNMYGLSVYKWSKSSVRYGLWNEAENSFTLPLFESIQLEGDQVRYTISGKEYKLGVKEFLRHYKASVKLTYGLDVTHKGINQVSDPSDLLEPEEEVVEEEAIPFQLVETKPSFNGGDANMFSKWVNERLVYPEIAKENGVQGRVTLQFTVGKDGSVTNVKVLRGVDPSLDKEAVRVVSMSPKWKPGKQRDRAVPVTYTFPVIFRL